MAKGLRRASCYHWDTPAFTRVSKNPSTSFITGIPGSKLIHYDMGNRKGEFDTEVSIVNCHDIIIRHNALEAARIAVSKHLTDKIGSTNFRFRIRVYPHHIMRENAGATGAGADRVSDGMRRSYGKPIGRAARIHNNSKVFTVYINEGEERIRKAKNALKKAIMKLPGTHRITVEIKKEDGKGA